MLKRNSAGFTLIELVIAIALSGIIALVLYAGFWQTQRTVKNIRTISERDTALMIVYHQLERDLLGAFVPLQGLPQRKPLETAPETQPLSAKAMADLPAEALTKEGKQTKEKKEAAQKQEEAKKKAAEQKPVLKQVFNGTSKGQLFNQLTFITHNPLVVYVDPRQEVGTVRAVRVMYTLEENKEQPGTYILFRQESPKLDIKEFKDTKKIKRYELARNIQRFSVVYIYEERQEKESVFAKTSTDLSTEVLTKAGKQASAVTQEAQKRDQEKKQKPKQYAQSNQWSTDERLARKEQPLLPSFVQVKLLFADAPAETQFLFLVPAVNYIPTEQSTLLPEQADKKEQQDQKEQKSKKEQSAKVEKTKIEVAVLGDKKS